MDDLTKCNELTGPGCIPVLAEQATLDAWGNKYQFQSSGGTFMIKTLGSDGKPGGEGAAYDDELKGP